MSVLESILFATSNPHKVEEVAGVLAPLGMTVVGIGTLSSLPPEPVEDGRTFLANALIKAHYYAARCHRLVLADDSGLEVDALGGAPGVHSARYAGATGPRSEVDAKNNALLIRKLAGVPVEKRTARFVCVLTLCDAHRVWAVSRGVVCGRIIDEPRGRNGFGYDPHFELTGRGVTTAQLAPEEKNAISHRGQAARVMAKQLPRLNCESGGTPAPQKSQTADFMACPE